MSDFKFIVIIAIVVIALIAFFKTAFGKQLKVKAQGRADEVMRQDATTPEGARDYYNAAIREKEELYNRASASYMEVAGKLESSKKDLFDLNKEIMKVTKQINSCLDENDEEMAMKYALKKTTLENKIQILKDTIESLKQAEAHHKEVRGTATEELEKLKEEKELTLFQIEADMQSIRLNESMDSLSTNSETDRMLERVRDGARKTRERAEGSRIAYESSSQTQDRRLEASEQQRNARQMLEEMKRQRGQR